MEPAGAPPAEAEAAAQRAVPVVAAQAAAAPQAQALDGEMSSTLGPAHLIGPFFQQVKFFFNKKCVAGPGAPDRPIKKIPQNASLGPAHQIGPFFQTTFSFSKNVQCCGFLCPEIRDSEFLCPKIGGRGAASGAGGGGAGAINAAGAGP